MWLHDRDLNDPNTTWGGWKTTTVSIRNNWECRQWLIPGEVYVSWSFSFACWLVKAKTYGNNLGLSLFFNGHIYAVPVSYSRVPLLYLYCNRKWQLVIVYMPVFVCWLEQITSSITNWWTASTRESFHVNKRCIKNIITRCFGCYQRETAFFIIVRAWLRRENPICLRRH